MRCDVHYLSQKASINGHVADTETLQNTGLCPS